MKWYVVSQRPFLDAYDESQGASYHMDIVEAPTAREAAKKLPSYRIASSGIVTVVPLHAFTRFKLEREVTPV